MDGWGPGKEQAEEASVDRSQSREVGDRDTFVDLMKGVTDESKLDNGAQVLDEARIGGATTSRKYRRDAGNLGDGGGQWLKQLLGAGQERLGGQRRAAKFVWSANSIECLADQRLDRLQRPGIGKADVEAGSRARRDDVDDRSCPN